MPTKEMGYNEVIQLEELHNKIEKKESIEQLIKSINPDYLLDIINFPRSYITRDLSNSDGLTAVHVAYKHGNLDALKIFSNVGSNFTLTTTNYGRVTFGS